MVKAPHGTEMSCKGWLQEAALRMLMNNLDPEVAERPEDLIVYGGRGKAARNIESYNAIVKSLQDLENNETHTFQLVDYHEADPLNGKISVDSPVGKIILGKSKNDKVSVNSPSGTIEYQIISNTDR